MLRITQSESLDAARAYFRDALTVGDYYIEDFETVLGRGGKGTRILGLEGKITKSEFHNLLEAKSRSGRILTRSDPLRRRPGYDFTFDVPKSVSLLHSLQKDKRIEHVFQQAVETTMSDIEDGMYARVRKGGANEDRLTGNMIWFKFQHTTTRPAPDENGLPKGLPDPHLHIHAYVPNLTFDAVEGQWKAGEFSYIKQDAPYYQALYHTRLAEGLQKLGYVIRPTRDAFEIEGVSQELVSQFSRRSRFIEEKAAELGIMNEKAKSQLGAFYRESKNKDFTYAELVEQWRGALSHENENALNSLYNDALAHPNRIPDRNGNERAFLHTALDHIFERVSQVDEKRLVAEALRMGIGQCDTETLWNEVRSSPDILRARVGERTYVSTQAILAEEGALFDHVRDGRGGTFPIYEEYTFQTGLFCNDQIDTTEQKQVIQDVMASRDWIYGVEGKAGTGKTSVLTEIEAGLNEKSMQLIPVAPTAVAARDVLRKEGFEAANTVQSLLHDAQAGQKLKGNVLWVDEAGMMGNKDLLSLLNLAKENAAAKVILAGDTAQIRSVTRGDALRTLRDVVGLQTSSLHTIRRQSPGTYLRKAVETASRGDISESLNILETAGDISERPLETLYSDAASTYTKLTKNPKRKVLAIAPTHVEGQRMTRLIRENKKENGQLGKRERAYTRLINLKLTDAEKRLHSNFSCGGIIQFKQNAKGITKGQKWAIKDIDHHHNTLALEEAKGRAYELDLTRTKTPFEAYREDTIQIAEGDRIRITQNGQATDGKYRLNNGSFHTVKKATAKHIELSNRKKIDPDFGHLTHGYCITADSAQATTVDDVVMLMGSPSLAASDMRRYYVMVSRAKKSAKVFTDDKEELRRAASRETPRMSATEMLRIQNETDEFYLNLNRHRLMEDQIRRERELQSDMIYAEPSTLEHDYER